MSIIIVTFNSRPALDNSLTCLKQGLDGIDYELIVVDNSSTDGSVESVRRHFPGARIIEMTRNEGFAAACNQGAWIAKGEYLLFHNPDVCLDRGAVGHLTGVFQSRERVGAVSGRMRYPDGSFQATCRNFPTLANLSFSRGSVLSLFYGERARYTLPDYMETTEVSSVAGTVMMIHRDLFVAMNGFDERFFMYMEDTDLCMRLHRRGYTNFFAPEAGGIHFWGKGSRAGKVKRLWYHHVSVWKYSLKYFPKPISLIILPVILIVNFLLAALLPRPSEKRLGT
ncbi:MAG: glycosyltransferase family 2 protein [Candidatus Zixiibacteriota bacterium]|nr:MAG: glycosyltransferase family 2 protein [candidate division Zixibacteria bacterium]